MAVNKMGRSSSKLRSGSTDCGKKGNKLGKANNVGTRPKFFRRVAAMDRDNEDEEEKEY